MRIQPFAMSRRNFMIGTAACVTLLPIGRSLAQSAPLTIRAAKGASVGLLENNKARTPVWSYNERVPGPVIRCRRGGVVDVLFENRLDQPSSIHWHGLRLDNAMDGVPGLTQDAVEPGSSFHYRFTAPDAGTFWYHPHIYSSEQVDRGLYGILVVEEDDAPAVDQDLLMVLDDWRLKDDGAVVEDFGNPHDAAHAGRYGNTATLNSEPYLKLDVAQNQRLRLRLCSTANARISAISIDDHELLVAAVDGQPVVPFAPEDNRILLSPGQRMDVIVDAGLPSGTTAKIRLITQSEKLEIGELRYGDAPARAAPLPPFLPLQPNIEPVSLNLGQARNVDVLMQGGAMGQLPDRLAAGMSHDHGHAETAPASGPLIAWALNGTAGMPDAPLFAARRNEQVIIAYRNETLWPHAMHLHGHHVREVSENGVISDIWRDTVLVDANETRRVAIVCDNPGKWMLHCHMLEHQASGMMSWFTVS